MTWLWWTGVVFIVVVGLLVWALCHPTYLRDRPHEPEPALRPAQHRVRDASDPPEMAWVRTLDAATLPNIRVEVAAEKAATAIAGIPLPVVPELACPSFGEVEDGHAAEEVRDA